MNLYLICHVDTDAGHNMDLFVRCDTPEEAIDLWRIYFEGWFPDNDEDNSVMGLEKDPPDALPDHVFLVPEGVREHFAEGIGKRGAELNAAWKQMYEAYGSDEPEAAAQLDQMERRELPDGWDSEIPTFEADEKGTATRKA